MKSRKHKQRGGSKIPYTRRETNILRGVGFTDDQIRYLNNIKKVYGLESLNIDGIVFLINENADENINPTSYTAFYENKYKDDAYTDNEDDGYSDDEDDNNLSGGRNKSKTHKRTSRYLTKRETRRRRRKSIKRRNTTRKSRRRRRA